MSQDAGAARRPGVSRRAWAGIALGTGGLVAVVALTVSAGGPGSVPGGPGSDRPGVGLQAPSDRQDRLVKEMLSRRAAAVRAGDEAAWLSDVDSARGEVVARERWRFGNWRQLRPVAFELMTAGRDRLPAGAEATYQVQLVLRLPADVALNRLDYRYTVAFTDTAVRVLDVTHLSRDSPDAARPRFGRPGVDVPWDGTPLRSARQGGVTVLAAQGGRHHPDAYLDAAVRAERFVRSLWRGRPAPAEFVIFLADDAQFLRWFGFGGTGSSGGVAGYVDCAEISHDNGTPKVVDRARESLAGCRIVLRMSTVADQRRAYTLMVHEIAHAVGPHLLTNLYFGGDHASFNRPTWALEGFAEWAENIAGGRADTDQAMALVRQHWRRYRPGGATVPPNAGFLTGDQLRTAFNYELSSAFFHAAEAAGGRQKAVDLYVKLAASPILVTDSRTFLDPVIARQGINADRLWRIHRGLIR